MQTQLNQNKPTKKEKGKWFSSTVQHWKYINYRHHNKFLFFLSQSLYLDFFLHSLAMFRFAPVCAYSCTLPTHQSTCYVAMWIWIICRLVSFTPVHNILLFPQSSGPLGTVMSPHDCRCMGLNSHFSGFKCELCVSGVSKHQQSVVRSGNVLFWSGRMWRNSEYINNVLPNIQYPFTKKHERK